MGISGLLYPSGELRPRSSGGYETDYPVAYAGMWDSYGQGVVYDPTADADGYGIPDVFERERPGSCDFSGNTIRQWASAVFGTLTLGPASAQHNGAYTVTVSNNAGSTMSSTATVTVLKPTGQLHFGLQRFKPESSFQMVFEGVAGRTYPVDYATSVGSWTTSQTVQATSSWTSVTVPRTPGVSRQFFRVK